MSGGKASVGSQMEAADDPCSTAVPEAPQDLADLPAAWLRQLAEALEPEARMPLFQTCTAMQTLMLSQHPVRLQFHVPVPEALARAAEDSLALACRLSGHVKLLLVGEDHDLADQVASQASACNLVAGAMAAVGQGLTAIKSVQLRALQLDHLLPSLLTCPHLTSLQLHACWFNHTPHSCTSLPACGSSHTPHACGQPDPTPAPSLHACGQQLKQLLLHHPVSNDQSLLAWKQQVHALPGLESLTIDIGQGQSQELARWLDCFSACGPQYTQLTLSCRSSPAEPPFANPQYAGWFANVTQLSMGWRVRDAEMEVLLSMNNLRRLQCQGFQLVWDRYRHRPCTWTQLVCSELDVESLSLLPLEGVTSLQQPASGQPSTSPGQTRLVVASGPRFTIRPSIHRVQTGLVIAAISAAGGIQWAQGTEHITVDVSMHPCSLIATSGCMADTMPLLSSCPAKSMEFYAAVVSTGLTGALRWHGTGWTALRCIRLRCCAVHVHVWPMLLPSLPSTVQDVHVQQSHMSEAHLTSMCAASSSPVTVHIHGSHQVGYRWEVGWEQRVQAAMAAAGHQFVEIVV